MKCTECGRELEADEIEYYGNTCEGCERRLSGLVDYQAWVLELCALLDKIEQSAGNPKKVRNLCAGRFKIARDHGVEVKFTGEQASGAEH